MTTTLLVPMGNTLITKGMTTHKFIFCLRYVTHRTFHTNYTSILFKPHLHLHQRGIRNQTLHLRRSIHTLRHRYHQGVHIHQILS
jgi:hypothetical protein